MSYLKQYAEAIDTGEIIAGNWLKRGIQNLLQDLADERYIYDTADFERRLKFQEAMCLQSKAPFYMQPIKYELWQKAFWEVVYSFKIANTGKRRFTEVLLEVARKNGKTTMFAVDGNTDLFIGAGGEDICCASNDDRQAKLIWLEIAQMRNKLDAKRTITGQNLTLINNRIKNINIMRLSAKTQNKDGFNFSKVYLDESHDMESDEIAEALWRAMSTREEPLLLNCTTQGFITDAYLDKKISYAKRVITGEIDDINFLAFLYEQDSEQEVWQDEASWEKSNPSLRAGIKKKDKIKRDIEVAKIDKETRMHLLTKDFNIKVGGAEAWLMLEDYDYKQTPFDLADFKNSFCLGAVDLSATTDLSSAKVLLMRAGDKTKYIHSHYWIPESKLDNSDDRESGAKYTEWARQGILTIHESNEIDISQIADWYFKLYKDYGIRLYKCGYDQRYAKTFLDKMDDYGFETEMIYQGKALSTAMKLTEADLKANIINYNNNEIDKWCLGNTACQLDRVGNIMPIKILNQPSKRIDGAVSLIILNETLRRNRADFELQVGRI